MKVKVLHINDKLLTVESLTQTKSFSLAISFSPIQCLVLGQSSFQFKKNVMISYMFKASKLVHYPTTKHSLFLSELYIMSILTKYWNFIIKRHYLSALQNNIVNFYFEKVKF